MKRRFLQLSAGVLALLGTTAALMAGDRETIRLVGRVPVYGQLNLSATARAESDQSGPRPNTVVTVSAASNTPSGYKIIIRDPAHVERRLTFDGRAVMTKQREGEIVIYHGPASRETGRLLVARRLNDTPNTSLESLPPIILIIRSN